MQTLHRYTIYIWGTMICTISPFLDSSNDSLTLHTVLVEIILELLTHFAGSLINVTIGIRQRKLIVDQGDGAKCTSSGGIFYANV